MLRSSAPALKKALAEETDEVEDDEPATPKKSKKKKEKSVDTLLGEYGV